MDFWSAHGWLFLIGVMVFPRITLLLFSFTPFGWWHWLAWAFAPHLLVAALATRYYWDTNPLMCVAAWIIGITATFGEGKTANTCGSRPRGSYVCRKPTMTANGERRHGTSTAKPARFSRPISSASGT